MEYSVCDFSCHCTSYSYSVRFVSELSSRKFSEAFKIVYIIIVRVHIRIRIIQKNSYS